MIGLLASSIPFAARLNRAWWGRETSFRKMQRRHALTGEELQKRRVAEALWRAFPSATSEHALAEMAAPHFRKANGKPISPRTIRYWLRGDTLPDHMHTMVLVGLVGAATIFGVDG